MTLKSNIVLCGFMGSGKTSAGKKLSELTGRDFFDIDNYIENQEGISINEIFYKHGEMHFRGLEAKAVQSLSERENIIISCGGGTVLNPDNIASLKKNGVIFFLDVGCETVLRRLANDASRPLLAKSDKKERIESLIKQRKPLYAYAADFTVDANAETDAVTDAILSFYGKLKQ